MPAVIGDYRGIKDGDGVLCFNFRADRVREILGAMLDPDFAGFPRKRKIRFAAAVGMTAIQRRPRQADGGDLPAADASRTSSARSSPTPDRTQLRMAETEKYPHVTYFLNGGREEPYPGRGPHHGALAQGRDLRPAARDVGAGTDRQGGRGDRLRQVRPDRAELRQSRHGRPHRQPARRDQGGGDGRHRPRPDRRRRSPKQGGALLVTADHGNCETDARSATGGPHTAHTTNPVPVVLLGAGNRALLADGRLADIAPTLLELMDLPQPKEMTGVSLLRGN